MSEKICEWKHLILTKKLLFALLRFYYWDTGWPLTFFSGSGGGLVRERLLNTCVHRVPCSLWYLQMVEWCTMVRRGFLQFLRQEKMYWKQEKKKKQGDEWKEGCLVRPQMLPSVRMHSCRLFICSRLMQAKSHYVQHGRTGGSLSAGSAGLIWVTPPAGSRNLKTSAGISSINSTSSADSLQIRWVTCTGQAQNHT